MAAFISGLLALTTTTMSRWNSGILTAKVCATPTPAMTATRTTTSTMAQTTILKVIATTTY